MPVSRSYKSRIALLVGVLAGCHRPNATTEVGDADITAALLDDDAAVVETIAESVNSSDAAAEPVLEIAALHSPTPISSRPEWPANDPTKASDERLGVIRLGYLRKGAKAAVKPKIIKRASCPEGWYELVSGGYVCGKYATRDMSHPELAKAPHPPFLDRPLPYDYGLNLTNGAPIYRRVPLRRERKEVERGLAIGKTSKKADAGAPTAPEPPAPPVTNDNGEVPWYLKSYGGKRPQLTLGDLKGERGLVELRMVRGFYLALDQRAGAFSGRMWRTTSGSFVPADFVLVHKTKTEFEGARFQEGSDDAYPVAWVLGLYARKYRLSDDESKMLRDSEKIARFTRVGLTGKVKTVEGRSFLETNEGWWMRDLDGTASRAGPPPSDLAPGEKWIDVNLKTQTLVAFEGDKPVFATLISSGRHNDEDKSQDHRTVTGSFRIREKHIAATMEDDGASDGPYSIQDVPWIMYFQGSYALHGAFWHANFGHERSHGCVNLQPVDAKWLFEWAGPNLPSNWHGVRATGENPGTRVIVHE